MKSYDFATWYGTNNHPLQLTPLHPAGCNEVARSRRIQEDYLAPVQPRRRRKVMKDHLDHRRHRFTRMEEMKWAMWNGSWQLDWMDIDYNFELRERPCIYRGLCFQ